MASSRTQGSKCYVCKDFETLPSKPLIRCQRCPARYHPCCHKPAIYGASEFICRKCEKKSADGPSFSTPVSVSTQPRKSTATETLKEHDSLKGGRPCTIPGCNKFAESHQKPDSKVLCKGHEIYDKHSAASAQSTTSKSQTSSRPIKKNKLYPVRPDDRPLLKRKRMPTAKKSTSYEGLGASVGEESLQSREANGINQISDASPPKTALRTSQQKRKELNNLTSVDRHLENDHNGSLGSASMATSPITEVSSRFGSSYLRPGSTGRTPQLPTSPDYEPPPHDLFDNGVNPWSRSEDDDESPGSQIAQELRATTLQDVEANAIPTCIVEKVKSRFPEVDYETIRKSLRVVGNSFENAERLLCIAPQLEPLVAQSQPFSSNLDSNQFPVLQGLGSNEVLVSGVETSGIQRGKAGLADADEPDERRLATDSQAIAQLILHQNYGKNLVDSSNQQQPATIPILSRHTVQNQSKNVDTPPDTAQREVVGASGDVPEDEEMADAECFEFSNEALSEREEGEAAIPDQPPLVSPEMDSPTDTDDALDANEIQLDRDPHSGHGPETEQEHGLDLFLSPSPEPSSIEAGRVQKAATYDSSELDFWLNKKSQPRPDYQPTAQELLKTQTWGHIDPRKVWPKVFTASWLEEKRKEIDARGGKKANYGKVITQQNRKERMERGWSIHQSREANQDTEERRERVRKVEELIGIKDISEMVPAVRNGVLCMVDPPEKEQLVQLEGRKKKKVVRVYPVG